MLSVVKLSNSRWDGMGQSSRLENPEPEQCILAGDSRGHKMGMGVNPMGF